MAELTPLFVDVDDFYGADELGLPFRDIVREGVVNPTGGALAVSQRAAGANMSVDVAAGSCWVQGDTDTAAQPTYRCRSDAVVNLGITADATNPRNVIIVAEVLDNTFDGGGSNLWRLRAVHGTPAGSPADPATPTSAIRLARVSVTAADTSIIDAQITDLREEARLGGTVRAFSQGEDVASASTIAVTHPFHKITGTTSITSITAQDPGFVVTLEFAGALTFTDGSNLKIGGNFTTANESTITLVCDGTNWFEIARSPAPSVNVQEFTSSGTWTKPAAASVVLVVAYGGGGGGGGGSTSLGGSGGGGGARVERFLDADDCAATETVTIAAITGAAAAGADGTAGGTTTFGSLISAYGGGAGIGTGGGGGSGGGGGGSAGTGTTGSASAANGGIPASVISGNDAIGTGGAKSPTAGAGGNAENGGGAGAGQSGTGPAGGSSLRGAAGGGAGASNTANTGGAGGASNSYAAGGGGTAGATSGGAGGAGAVGYEHRGGAGGGGGGGNAAGTGGVGGDGGAPGGGGGGGGRGSAAGGAGGKGARGGMWVFTW